MSFQLDKKAKKPNDYFEGGIYEVTDEFKQKFLSKKLFDGQKFTFKGLITVNF